MSNSMRYMAPCPSCGKDCEWFVTSEHYAYNGEKTETIQVRCRGCDERDQARTPVRL